MDEPSMGLAPVLVDSIFQTIEELHGSGTTILLVEQNARMALAVSDRVFVLSKGSLVFAGATAEFHQREQELKGRYLSV
jgi:branched-chain amino acid transport system ATP-binding protein